MDEERYILEGKSEIIKEIQSRTGGKVGNYRLMQEWEVPEWAKIRREEKDEDG